MISLNRPEKHNAMDNETGAALGEALRWAFDSTEVRCILLRGEGPSFCSGRDTTQLGQREPGDNDFAFVRRAQDRRLEQIDSPKPFVAAVRGACIGGGFEMALATLNGSRVGIGAMCLGVAKEALDLGWRNAHEREMFGQTVGDFQVTQHAFADMAIEVYAAESLIYRTAVQLDAGQDVAAEASSCKVFASEAAQRVVDRALQMHGGAGYLKDSPIERLYRDIRVARIYEGANEVQRNNVYRVMRRQRGR